MVDLETVMLNFRKISPRPPWSKFHQSSKTFMFTPKAKSKKKCVWIQYSTSTLLLGNNLVHFPNPHITYKKLSGWMKMQLN